MLVCVCLLVPYSPPGAWNAGTLDRCNKKSMDDVEFHPWYSLEQNTAFLQAQEVLNLLL